MPETALSAPDNDATTPQASKPPRIPKRVRHACELIADGKVATITAAAERVGLSREHLSKTLSRPHVQAFIARKSRETIGTSILRASNRLVGLIDAKSEHVAAQVSERILTSEGILKTDQRAISVNVDVRAGFVLDLREDQPALTTHQRQIDAKPLIEHDNDRTPGE